MANPYGIDGNGNLYDAADNGGGNGGQQQCPQGQKYDYTSQSCQPINTTGGNPAPPQTAPPSQQQSGCTAGYDANGWCLDGSGRNRDGRTSGTTTTPPPATPPPPTQYPSYVNPNDAANMAVWNAFAAKGIQPGGPAGAQGDFQYWVNFVNANGGPTSPYVLNRLAQASGGVGDYGQNGGGNTAGNINTFLTGPTTPPPTFTPPPVDPNQKNITDLITRMLTTTSMSPDVVAQMREGAKETNLSGAEQIKEQIRQSAASRGVGGGSAPIAASAGVDLSALGNISDAYRNIDIQKATQDRTDQQNAASLAAAFQGQTFNQDLNVQAAALQSWLASQGLTLNWAQLQEAMRQFNMNNELDVAKYLSS